MGTHLFEKPVLQLAGVRRHDFEAVSDPQELALDELDHTENLRTLLRHLGTPR